MTAPHYCPMKFELVPDHDWLVYIGHEQTGIDELCHILKYVIYGFFIKIDTLALIIDCKKFKILFGLFFLLLIYSRTDCGISGSQAKTI